MTHFHFDHDALELPKGAYAKTTRRWLSRGGKRILALTNGPFRPYLFPLFSPAGYLLASESPADHPHHNALWVGADHVHLKMPTGPGRHEDYTYNFYVNETFQGRAPGRQIEIACEGAPLDADRFRIHQTIEWRGPSEWAAPDGRVVLQESRQIDVTAGARFHRIDMRSTLRPTSAAIQLGPTRHAFFNARVAETMLIAHGGRLESERGPMTAAAIMADGARWVDFTGPVGGDARAGITLAPHPVHGHDHTWFVADWGVMTAGAFRATGLLLPAGAALDTGCTWLLHDGDLDKDARQLLATRLPTTHFPQPQSPENKDQAP